jgi:hypothetical protein
VLTLEGIPGKIVKDENFDFCFNQESAVIYSKTGFT